MADNTKLIGTIDRVIQNLWEGGVNNPIDYIEQISYLIFLKLLDEKEEDRERMARIQKKPYEGVFSGKNERFRFRNWARGLAGEELKTFIEASVFPFIRELSALKKEEREYFRNAHLKIYEPGTLKVVVESIAEIDFSKFDFVDKGDLYEHMLGRIAKSGVNGQYRTPRHIIGLMVKLADPEVMETVYDPSCGTAGFLLGAYLHMLTKHSDKKTLRTKTDDRGTPYLLGVGDRLNERQRDFLYSKTFYGYDIDANMVRFSIMNLILHGFSEGTNIRVRDTLGKNAESDEDARKYDIVLANPPFAGSIAKERVGKDDFPVFSSSTEILFLGHIIQKLRNGGRCAVVVPEGVVFKTNKDYIAIRKYLLEKCSLKAVVSLPSGVFQPYSGVKTNILVFTKGKPTERVWFYDLKNDGYEMGSQRKPLAGPTDIEDLLAKWEVLKGGKGDEGLVGEKSWFADMAAIAGNDYDISATRYKAVSVSAGAENFAMARLGDICEIQSGGTPDTTRPEFWEGGTINWATLVDVKQKHLTDTHRKITEAGLDGSAAKILPLNTVLFSSRATIGDVSIAKVPTATNQGFKNFICDPKKVDFEYLYYVLKHEAPKIEALCSGSTYKEISKTQIANYKIPLPSLARQKEIVEKLNEKQAVVDGANEMIGLAERERGDFEEYIGVKEHKMEQLGSICRRVDETVNPEEDGGFGVFVGLENIQSKLGRVVGKLWCDYSSIKSTKTRFLAGDVLYGKLRPNLNKVWVADTPGICSTDIVVFRTDKDKVSPEYLSHLLRSQRINEKILEGVSGASLPRVSVGYLLSLSVPVPELADQVEISNKMSAKDKAAHYLTKWKGEAVRQMDAYFEKIL